MMKLLLDKKTNRWLRIASITIISTILLLFVLASTRDLGAYIYNVGSSEGSDIIATTKTSAIALTIGETKAGAAAATNDITGAITSIEGYLKTDLGIADADAHMTLTQVNGVITGATWNHAGHLFEGGAHKAFLDHVKAITTADNGLAISSKDATAHAFSAAAKAPILGGLLWGTQSTVKVGLALAIVAFVGAIAQIAKLYNPKHVRNNFVNSLVILVALTVALGFAAHLAILITIIVAMLVQTVLLTTSIFVEKQNMELA